MYLSPGIWGAHLQAIIVSREEDLSSGCSPEILEKQAKLHYLVQVFSKLGRPISFFKGTSTHCYRTIRRKAGNSEFDLRVLSGALVTRSFLLLLVRHLFLVAWHLLLIANIVTTSKALVTRSDALVSSSVLAPSSDALVSNSFLLLVRHFLTSFAPV